MNRQKLESALKKAGLKRNDIVLLHSSLLSLGEFEGGPDDVIDAFLRVLGPKGTLVVPVFGALGILTETVKKRKSAVVSTAPVGTLAAIGGKAKEICADHWECETAHGEGTPYLKIADLGGYVCLLGVDQDRNTTLHSIEALLKLPYLSDTTATVTPKKGKPKTKTWKYYPGPHRDFIGLDKLFREAGIMRTSSVGNAVVRLIKAREMIDLGLELGKKDPAFVLCDNPRCADCVKQRAAIFSDRIANHESFRLSASSRLAGYYVPEIIDKLKAVGIHAVELDYVQGLSAVTLPAEKLAAVCSELTAAGIEISALRVPVIPSDTDKMLSAVKGAGIERLILPLPRYPETLEKISDAGLRFSLVNTQETTVDLNRLLMPIRKKHSCCTTFNPVNFVRANEHPFLYSWHVGRFIKCIGQLDLVDAKWDMTPTPLAGGNAEIKELISIIRCHHYKGWFTLGGGAPYPGTLKDAVNNFTNLLDNI
ncbi:MAG: AAC(3) family N-acetyltransferase [Lentisphaerae bacterium]|nr:AAC(3) family N-acetyltransferase [Lentisphaerota bacterium]